MINNPSTRKKLSRNKYGDVAVQAAKRTSLYNPYSTGGDPTNGVSPISFSIGKPSSLFAADKVKALPTTETVYVFAYEGKTEINAYINLGSLTTTASSGMTVYAIDASGVQITSPDTPVKGIYITVGDNLYDPSGTIKFTLYASEPTLEGEDGNQNWVFDGDYQRFSYPWALAFKGADGEKGENGKDGVNGTDGTNGKDGISIIWKGEFASHPQPAQLNWCYRNTTDGIIYVYNGYSWEVMTKDGSDGADGADGKDGVNGADGHSVFITYHDNDIDNEPPKPTGDGTTNGWHLVSSKYCNWMSQKLAASITEGEWSNPIQIAGRNGQNGEQGLRGASIRGPYEWVDNEMEDGKRFCNGEASATVGDEKWIDVIYLRSEDKYYICTTSFTYSTSNGTWNDCKSNFTVATDSFKFIASDLILARNANINFLDSNELRLKDGRGNITGGAAGGDGVNFWAGKNVPDGAPYRVNNDGSLYAENADIKGHINATSGTFAGYVRMPYTFVTNLEFKERNYYADERAYIFCNITLAADVALLLPNPTLDLNGFTYHIITPPNIATKPSGQNYGLTIKTVDRNNHFDVYSCTQPIFNISTLCCFGGHIEITCVPAVEGSEYEAKWIVTQCTGGVDCMRVSIPTISSVTSNWKYYGVDYRLKSPTIGSGEETWCRIDFTIKNSSKDIKIIMRASSESGSDWGYIGNLDSTASSTSYNNRVSGTDTIEVVYTPTNGTHYVYVGYKKDGSKNVNDDCVYVDITGATESLEVGICTLTGVSFESNNIVTRVMAQETLPTKKDWDTIYIQR